MPLKGWLDDAILNLEHDIVEQDANWSFELE